MKEQLLEGTKPMASKKSNKYTSAIVPFTDNEGNHKWCLHAYVDEPEFSFAMVETGRRFAWEYREEEGEGFYCVGDFDFKKDAKIAQKQVEALFCEAEAYWADSDDEIDLSFFVKNPDIPLFVDERLNKAVMTRWSMMHPDHPYEKCE
jgi:hypothetical protein